MHIPGRYPIMTFKDDKELNECLKWWIDRLYLHDWIIHGALKDHVYVDEKEMAGSNTFEHGLMSSCILISTAETGETKDTVSKVCHELTLVHELLHLRLNWLQPPYSYEGNYTDAMEHQNIEKFARSLIMAKYRLPLEWFDTNYSYAEEGYVDETHSIK